MRPYSNDLRIRVINAYKNGEGSQRELARRFCVCLATVQNWLKRFRDTGHLQPKDYRRGPQPRIDQRSLCTLQQIIANKPEATLEALCEDFLLVRQSSRQQTHDVPRFAKTSRPTTPQ